MGKARDHQEALEGARVSTLGRLFALHMAEQDLKLRKAALA